MEEPQAPGSLGRKCCDRLGLGSTWRDAVGIASFCVAVFSATQFPTVPGGDSGELIVAACSLGIPHPPGYPLHTMLGYAAVQLLPFGAPAARVTFVSVLSSAGASALLYLTIVHLTRALVLGDSPASNVELPRDEGLCNEGLGVASDGAPRGSDSCPHCGGEMDQERRWMTASRAAGIAGAGLHSFSPLVWTYSTQAEVFALNNLFVIAMICLTTLYLVPLGHEHAEAESGAAARSAGRETKDESAGEATSASQTIQTEGLRQGTQVATGTGTGTRGPDSEAERNGCIPHAAKWDSTCSDMGRSHMQRNGWIPYAGAVLIGLGLTNQHTLVLLAAPLALAVVLAGRALLLRPGAMLTLIGCGLVGLTPYLYLVWAGEQPQRGAWGDPASLRGLAVHVFRREYGTWKLFSGSDGQEQGLQSLRSGTWLYLCDLPRQQLLFGPACVVLGVQRLLARACTRTAAWWLVAAWLGYTVVFHLLANLPLEHSSHRDLFRAVHARFWLQPNAILGVLLGVGLFPLMLAALAAPARAAARASGGCEHAREGSRALECTGGASACWVLALGIVASQLALNYPACDKSQEWAVWEAGRATLLAAPRGALLLIKGDLYTNAVRYLLECEGARPDVQHLDLSHISYAWFNRRHARPWHANVTFPGRRFTRLHRHPPPGAFRLRDLLADNIRRRPIVLTSGLESLDPHILQDFTLWPSGVGYRVYPRERPPALRAWLRDNALRLPVLASDYLVSSERMGSWEAIAARDRAIAHAQVASHMLSVPPDHPSFTSSIPATDASHPSAPTGNDERCRLELPGSEDAERNARSSARRTGKAAAAVCGVVEGAEPGEGDRCSLGFLEACRGILVGKGQIDRVAWVRCAAQALICITSALADPPPLVWKNIAAALEQAQLAQAAATAGTSSDGDHVPFADDDASLEASKMLALHHYAVAALCSDAPPPLHPPASPSPHTSASSSTSSTSSSATSSPAPAASRAAGSGDAELSRIVEMLAAAGMPIPC